MFDPQNRLEFQIKKINKYGLKTVLYCSLSNGYMKGLLRFHIIRKQKFEVASAQIIDSITYNTASQKATKQNSQNRTEICLFHARQNIEKTSEMYDHN